MADTVRTLPYFKVKVPNTPGVCANALGAFRKGGVNLLAFSGFPRNQRAQLDFVPASPRAFQSAAKKAKLRIVGPKTCFLVRGKDRPGAVADLVSRLAARKINITALDAVCGGAGRFGAIFWVKERDVNKAKRALGAK